jgi:hypothetical protein
MISDAVMHVQMSSVEGADNLYKTDRSSLKVLVAQKKLSNSSDIIFEDVFWKP